MTEVKLDHAERKRRFLAALRETRPIDYAKLIALVVPIVHLVLTPIHVAALLKLEDQICGFIMFLSVLAGLVVCFEASRVRDDAAKSKVLFLLFLAVDCALLLDLFGIYRAALLWQQTLRQPEVVRRAVVLDLSILACYGAAILLTLASFRFRKRTNA